MAITITVRQQHASHQMQLVLTAADQTEQVVTLTDTSNLLQALNALAAPLKTAIDTLYGDVPVISSVSPATGPRLTATAITLTGRLFTGATAVTLGGVTCGSIVVVSDTSITCTTPSTLESSAGYDLVVVTPSGDDVKVAAVAQTVPAPTVTSISPTHATRAGGTTVTFTGTNLDTVTAAAFGVTAGTVVTPVSKTSATAVSPAKVAGVYAVSMTSPTGTGTLNTAWTADVPPPTYISVAPTSGTAVGGTTITITGTNLDTATGVTVGGVSCTSVTPSAAPGATLTCVTGIHAVGAVDIIVTTPTGSATGTAAYTYT